MAVLTAIERHDLERLLERFALGTLVRYWPASHGIENTNYFLSLRSDDRPGDEEEYVLTLLEEHPGPSLDFLVTLLDALDRAGLPVAPAVRNRDGAAIDALDGKPALIAPRLRGQHVLNPTLRHCEAVGRVLARLHRVAVGLGSVAPAYTRDAQWLTNHASSVRAALPFSDRALLDDGLAAVRATLARTDVQRLPRGVIHGDLFRDNVLFDAHALSGVLDFHHAGRGFWLYDIAVAVNDWCTGRSGVLDPERTIALLRGYDRVRRLERDELWWFPVFGLYAALAFWLSRLGPWIAADRCRQTPRERDERRLKHPDELKQVVRSHLARGFVPNARLIRIGSGD